MKKKILVRCITEYSKGFGNLNRCITLAEGLKRKGYKIIFLIDRKALAINEIKKKNFEYKIFKKYSRSKDEACAITNLIISNNYCSIIIDMREYGESLTKNLMNKNFEVILLDDAWCKNAYADLIFNGTFIKKYLHYNKINKDVQLFLGSKYLIANNELLKHRKKIHEIHDKKIYHVVISMGGSDQRDLSTFVLNSIYTIPNIDITVVIGPFFKQSSKIKKISKKTKNVTTLISPKKIWKIFQKADIVISNAGSTLFELAIMRVPTLCIPAVKHQVPYINGFVSRGFAINLGKPHQLNHDRIKNQLINVLNNKSIRKNMYLAGGKMIDGKGLSRTVQQITKFLKKT